MSFRIFPHTRTGFGAYLGTLTLSLLFHLQPALAESGPTDATDEHAGHALHHEAHQDHAAHQDHDAHKHHKVEPGYQRSLVSYPVPDVTMVNQDGQPVALPELLATDAPIMLNFIYTSCTAICPAMSATFARVQSELGSDSERVRMVSVSIDPEYDTPAALSAYARRFNAGPQWEFLTGGLDDSIAVQRAFDADRGDKMNHAPLTLFRASPESQWVRYDGFTTAAELVKECRGLL